MPCSSSEHVSCSPVLFLKHYIAASDGWKINFECRHCVKRYRVIIRPLANCSHLDKTCPCVVCRRQLLILLASAAHMVFTQVFNIERFDLTRCVTYEQYAYDVSSNRVCERKLVPPDFPVTYCHFRFICCSLHSFHRGCSNIRRESVSQH